MASSPSVPAPSALARQRAREILSEPRFHSPSVPRPLHSLLRELGRLLEEPVKLLEEGVAKAARSLPGGEAAVWLLLALLLLVAVAALSRTRVRRALRAAAPGSAAAAGKQRLTSRQLEARASAAEADGRYDQAVRDRFLAGLTRLGERELLEHGLAMANAEVARTLGSPQFDALARSFDEIAYGGRPASRDDAAFARREWSALLAGVGHA